MKEKTTRRALLYFILIAIIMLGIPVMAEVKIVTGPSPIEGDVLKHPKDITVYNDKIAASFAVGSKNYWGMTNGSISNLAIRNPDGSFGVNIVNDVEFLVNSWTASGGSLVADVTVIKDTPEEAIIQAKSTWLGEGKDNPLDIVTTYTLKDGSNIMDLNTIVTNSGSDTYEGLRSGYSISTFAAYMFGPFGYDTPDVRARYIHVAKDVDEPFGDFVVTYDNDYAVSIQMDDTEIYRGTTGYKDLHQYYDLLPGESREFTGKLHVEATGATSPMLEERIEREVITHGTISGLVKSDENKPIANPIVVVNKVGKYKGKFEGGQNIASDDVHSKMQTFVWAVGDTKGEFSFKLPVGDYEVYAVSKGYTPSKIKEISVTENSKNFIEFTNEFAVVQGGTASIEVTDKETGKPIDARIEVEGIVPAVKYIGASTYFTDIKDIGKVKIDLPVGDYTFKVMSGANFESLPEKITAKITSKKDQKINVAIDTLIDPTKEKWYAADLHHHTDIGDGSTSPLELVKSQLASRLNFIVVSDHDSVENYNEIDKYAQMRDIPFISSLEISPGWGHFNVLPMVLDAKIVNPALTTKQILEEAHKVGTLVTANHPYTDYGYFNNREIVPGGYSPNFDLIELQPTIDLSDEKNWDRKTLETTMDFWNDSLEGKSKKYYLIGGSDTHDVVSKTLYSGVIRTYAKVEDALSVDKYAKSLANGNSYASMGPLFFTDKVEFGESYEVGSGVEFSIDLDVFAVNGLDTVKIYNNSNLDKPIEEKKFNGSKKRETISFTLKPTGNSWYNIIAQDSEGNLAITNPIWVTVNKDGSIKVFLNDSLLSFEVAPIMENGRVLVPFRAIGEAIGAKVDYNPKTSTVSLDIEDRKVELVLGSKNAKVNGVAKPLDVPAKAINGRTLVPIRFVNEALGAEVDWQPQNQEIRITH